MFLPIILGTLIPTSLAMVQSAGGPGIQHLEFSHAIAPETADPNHPHLIATTLFEPAKAAHPLDWHHHQSLGDALNARGLGKEVVAAIDEERTAHLGLGLALAGKGQADAAIDEFRAALKLQPDDAAAHYNLGTALACRGQVDAAIDEYRAAIRLKPANALAHLGLGTALASKGQVDAAIAEYRAALKHQPDDAAAHLNLGTALTCKGQADAAIAEFRAALKLQPDDAAAHYNLGTALAGQGQVDAAIAEYRMVLKLQPDDASAYIGLGTALMGRGEFAGALAALRKGHELGSGQPGWPYPSAQWVRDAERMATLDARLPALLRGNVRPTDADEALSLARICSPKGLHAAAARLYQDAFARRPAWADDLASAVRYHAACAAAQAGSGRSQDDPPPDKATCVRWRKQALEWLQADLVLRAKQLKSGTPDARREVQQSLQSWKCDPALAGVRDEAEVAQLSEAERAACQKFWTQVDALLGDLASPANLSAR
jgi:eukaryotic-like serine/threonine-protein kinase